MPTARAYYNEHDDFAAAWLEELIDADLIAPGDVDSRSIADVSADDVRGYTQVHLFAGIGGWSLALRIAGWPDDKPVWTGSCPCQPFSTAGKGKGTKDERHLWPEFERLLAECRPPVVFGEQVASKAGRAWLAGVQTEVEALGYAFGGADLCAAGVGAPHLRQRLWWVADAGRSGDERGMRSGEAHGSSGEAQGEEDQRERGGSDAGGRVRSGGVGHPDRPGPQSREQASAAARHGGSFVSDGGAGGVGHADDARSQGRGALSECACECTPWVASLDCWIPCGDGKARRIEPSIEPLAHGVSGRVGRLRGYGNAIVPQVAATFIGAYADVYR